MRERRAGETWPGSTDWETPRGGGYDDGLRAVGVGLSLAKNMGRPCALYQVVQKIRKTLRRRSVQVGSHVRSVAEASAETQTGEPGTGGGGYRPALCPPQCSPLTPSSSTRPPFRRCLLDRRPHQESPAFHKTCFMATGCLLPPGLRSPVMPTEGLRKHLSLYRSDPDHFRP